MRTLPGSRTCSNAALLSRAQLPETEVTATVVDLLLSRLVTFSLVPIGNWLLEAAGAPPSPDSVTVEPAQTTSPLPALALPALPSPTQPAALRRCWIRSTTAVGDPRRRVRVRVRLLAGDEAQVVAQRGVQALAGFRGVTGACAQEEYAGGEYDRDTDQRCK